MKLTSDQERIMRLLIDYPAAQTDSDGLDGPSAILLDNHWIPLDPEPIRGLIIKKFVEWQTHSLFATDKGREFMEGK